MRRVLIGTLSWLVAAGIAFDAFRAPLATAATDRPTSKMFVPRDTDSFDPGVPVGQTFPAIRARYQDREISGVGEFSGPRGMVVYVVRSVDW